VSIPGDVHDSAGKLIEQAEAILAENDLEVRRQLRLDEPPKSGFELGRLREATIVLYKVAKTYRDNGAEQVVGVGVYVRQDFEEDIRRVKELLGTA
jgi:hypothetical protein